MHVKKVDIYILTGFLGSGKSTLLTQLLQNDHKKERRVGVLMNELGEVSIDSSVVPEGTPLKELLNGCICCTIQGELSLQLKLLLDEHELDVIYIEATGVAHPLDILDACTHPSIARRINIQRVLSLVNAKQWKDGKMSIKIKKLLMEQAKYADCLIVNKQDLLSQKELACVLEELKEINSNAVLFTTTYSRINIENIEPSSISYNVIDSKRFIQKVGQSEAHVHNHLHLHSFTFILKAPIDRLKFLTWLRSLPGQIYRAKGFLSLTETPGLFLFNYSYGEPIFERFHNESKPQQVIVIIGEKLHHDRMRKEIIQLQRIITA